MTLRVISLGAGVQSTTLALMAAAGEVGPMPDAAIFADTKWEPAAVYEHLARLERALPFPVLRVSVGDLRRDVLAGSNTTGQRFAAVPWFTIGTGGKLGMGRRQCTKEYKLVPIRREVVRLMGGNRPKGGAEVWIGISTDEALRKKSALVKYMVNRWPLLERGMSRRDCLEWLARAGWSAPRSACIGCPYHSDAEWRALAPGEFADAVAVDKAIREQPGFCGRQFMHAKRIPLDQVDLSTAEERGQIDLFNNECEGMCGL